MVYKLFDKKFASSGVNMHANNEKLAEELYKSIIKNFLKRTIYSGFKDNIWGADLADMQLIIKFNKDLDFYYVLLIFFMNMLGLFLWKIKRCAHC